MFKETSRYAALPVKVFRDAKGTEYSYVARRFLPPITAQPLAGHEVVGTAERLDHIAQRAYGDPEQYWRLVDVTLESDPARLTSQPGRRLAVAMILPDVPPQTDEGS